MTYVPDEGKLVGHADREKCTERLAQAVATGHLTQAAFEERRDRALEAVRRAHLDNLTADLPPEPKAPEKRYKTQVMGNGTPFSPRRWMAGITLSTAMIVLPGPLWAAAAHGFGHAPGGGAAPLFMIMAGVVGLLVFGIGFAPDGETSTDYRDYRAGQPGERFR